MRAPAFRPGWLQVAMIPCGYLSARQLRLLASENDPSEPVVDDRLDDLTSMCAFTAAVSQAFRSGGQEMFPPSSGGHHRILDQSQVLDIESFLEPMADDYRSAARRLSASAAVFALLIHGEQRDGIAGHGPYLTARGRRLIFIEYNDLTNSFLPWAPPSDVIGLDAISFMYEVPDTVEFQHDTYGSVATDPLDFLGQTLRMRVLGRRGSQLEPLSLAEIENTQRELASAADDLYAEILGWPDHMRVEYGGWLFANHLNTFVELAGAPTNLTDLLRDRAQATSQRMFSDLGGSSDLPNLYKYLQQVELPLFSPIQ